MLEYQTLSTSLLSQFLDVVNFCCMWSSSCRMYCSRYGTAERIFLVLKQTNKHWWKARAKSMCERVEWMGSRIHKYWSGYGLIYRIDSFVEIIWQLLMKHFRVKRAMNGSKTQGPAPLTTHLWYFCQCLVEIKKIRFRETNRTIWF